MKKITSLILTFVAIIVIGASCAASQKNTNTTTKTTTNTSLDTNTGHTVGSFSTAPVNSIHTTRVTITHSGIDQPTVTITLGSRIEFLNGDSVPHALYANPHPTHTSLPDFGQSIAAGATYAYTFLTAGTYSYHDDTAPTNTAWQGKVIVK